MINTLDLITWNIDLTLYSKDQLEAISLLAEDSDSSISKQIEDYISEKYKNLSNVMTDVEIEENNFNNIIGGNYDKL